MSMFNKINDVLIVHAFKKTVKPRIPSTTFLLLTINLILPTAFLTPNQVLCTPCTILIMKKRMKLMEIQAEIAHLCTTLSFFAVFAQ